MMSLNLLDNDLYKLTMMQAVWKKFPQTEVKYEFKCRTENVEFTEDDLGVTLYNIMLNEGVFSKQDISYLRTLNLFEENFLQFLSNFHLNAGNIKHF